jgi:CxxC motif-containing protein (DUF1111 family)
MRCIPFSSSAFRALVLALITGQAAAAAQDAPDPLVAAARSPPASFAAPEPWETRPGGTATRSALPGPDAFAAAAPDLSPAALAVLAEGRALFDRDWTEAEGLGPLWVARSCRACHGATGATAAPVWRLAPGPLGAQVQPRALPGLAGEPQPAAALVAAEEVALPGGLRVTLRRWRVAPLPGGLRAVPRVAAPLTGLALLAAVPEAALAARADPGDADGDGIAGRLALVPSGPEGALRAGRFGARAATATLEDQAALALARDMGLSTPGHPAPWGDCTPAQGACRDAAGPARIEVSETALRAVAAYSGALAVPARRAADHPQVLRGKALFFGAGCAACHQPKQAIRGADGRGQLIWPWTDLLLHDMGPGLDDGLDNGLDDGPEGRPGDAQDRAGTTGREWRTAPLWGLGLRARTPGARFLHDGRAGTVLEAILWHGGTAGRARDRVALLSATDRAALLRFLDSL